MQKTFKNRIFTINNQSFMITYNNPKDTERRSNVDPLSLEEMQNTVNLLNTLVVHADKYGSMHLLDEERAWLQNLIDSYSNLQHFYDNAGGWEGLAKLQETADSKGWISVNERLPEDEQDCIIYTGTQMFDGAIYWQSDKVWHVSEVGDLSTTEVTHWQPLPEPPTEKHNIEFSNGIRITSKSINAVNKVKDEVSKEKGFKSWRDMEVKQGVLSIEVQKSWEEVGSRLANLKNHNEQG